MGRAGERLGGPIPQADGGTRGEQAGGNGASDACGSARDDRNTLMEIQGRHPSRCSCVQPVLGAGACARGPMPLLHVGIPVCRLTCTTRTVSCLPLVGIALATLCCCPAGACSGEGGSRRKGHAPYRVARGPGPVTALAEVDDGGHAQDLGCADSAGHGSS